MNDQTSLLMTGETKPEDVLNLPKGRLKLGEFVVDFSPEQVLGYASAIVQQFERGEGNEFQHLFVSQAGVVEYAAREFGLGNLEAETF